MEGSDRPVNWEATATTSQADNSFSTSYVVATFPQSSNWMLPYRLQCNVAVMVDNKLPTNLQSAGAGSGAGFGLGPRGRHRHYSQDSASSSGNSTFEQEDFHFLELSHPVQVLTGLNCLRLAGLFCDVTLCVEEEEFPCHKIVMSSFSPYFKAMFGGELAESQQSRVSLKGLEAPMVKLLVEYAYTSEVTITKANVQSLLSAANLLEVLPVRDACCQFMERNMDESNCLGIHCFAEAHACSLLKDKAKDFALKYFAEVVKQDEFLHLTQAKVIEFLSSDDLEVETEEDVFNAVAAWLNHSPDTRKEGFEKVLEHVRLPLLTPYYVFDCVRTHPVIQASPACLCLLEEAKTFHLLPDRRHQLRSPRTRPRKSFGTVEVIVAVGGEDDKVVLRSVECFNPKTHVWATLACLPFAVSKHGLVASGGNVLYMAGGEFPDGSVSRSMWRYDPVFDNWLEMASMNIPRSELGLVLLDGLVYAVGGWEGCSRLESVERYDPKLNVWEFVSPLKLAVTSPAVVAHNGLLYVTGGAILEDGDGIDLVQCFNPKLNTWVELSPMLIARSGSAACVLNNCIYIIGGWHASTENTSKVECYDPRLNEWSIKSPMTERRYRPGVAVVDGKIYVCGGEEGWDRIVDRYHDTIECYDEESDTWNVVAEMPTSRSWLSCVALQLHKDSAAMKEKT